MNYLDTITWKEINETPEILGGILSVNTDVMKELVSVIKKSNATNLHRNCSAPRPIGKPSNDLQYTNKSIGSFRAIANNKLKLKRSVKTIKQDAYTDEQTRR